MEMQMHPLLLTLVLFCLSTPCLGEPNLTDTVTVTDTPPLLLPSFSQESTLELDVTATQYAWLVRVTVINVTTNATMDTGSDLMWLNGDRCTKDACEDQEAAKIAKPNPPDDTCHQPECKTLLEKMGSACGQDKSICPYDVRYPDGTESKGELSLANFTFDKGSGQVYYLWLGVSSETHGAIDPTSDGVVGLGPGKVSLVKQLRNRYGVLEKFSYCLPPPYSHGKLKIGKVLDVSADKITNAKLLDAQSCEDHYCVNFQGISLVGNMGQTSKLHLAEEEAKIIIDSGATFTFLTKPLFDEFLGTVKGHFGSSTPQCPGKKGHTYQHCFVIDSCQDQKVLHVKAQVLLKDTGNVVELAYYNFFDCLKVEDKHYACLTVQEAEEDHDNKSKIKNILGGRAQIGQTVTFDLSDDSDAKVSFHPHGYCSKPAPPTLECPS